MASTDQAMISSDDVADTGGGTQYSAGYEAIFCPELEKKYECPICLRAMRDAMQTSCGHRFCESCIMAVINQRVFAKCPVDNMWFRRHDELFPDNAVRREILSLTVKCSMDDCLWFGELRDLEAHNNTCEYRWVKCSFGCTGTIRRHDLTRHMEMCELRPVLCQHCNISVTKNYLMKHQVLECDKFPVQCTLCGESGIQREAIQRHLDKDVGNCPHVVIPCDYLKYGCTFEDKRTNMIVHLKECVNLHLDLAKSKVETLEKGYERLSRQVHDFTSTWDGRFKECASLLQEVKSLQRTNHSGQLTWKISLTNSRHKYDSKSFYTGIPGYKLHAVLELSGHMEGTDSFASMFVVFEKGRFDDEIPFPINARCKATVLGKESMQDNYSETIVCANVPRCRTEGEMSNYQRGRLKFMPTRLLLSPKYCVCDEIFIQINIEQINEK